MKKHWESLLTIGIGILVAWFFYYKSQQNSASTADAAATQAAETASQQSALSTLLGGSGGSGGATDTSNLPTLQIPTISPITIPTLQNIVNTSSGSGSTAGSTPVNNGLATISKNGAETDVSNNQAMGVQTVTAYYGGDSVSPTVVTASSISNSSVSNSPVGVVTGIYAQNVAPATASEVNTASAVITTPTVQSPVSSNGPTSTRTARVF